MKGNFVSICFKKCNVFFLCIYLYLAIIPISFASQEVHESQRHSVRKSGVHIEYTNFESNYVSFDVKYNSRIINTIKYKIYPKQKKYINKKIIETFLSNEFDRIRIIKNKLILYLPDGKKKVSVSYNGGIYWDKPKQTLEKFSSQLNTYLNERIQGPAKKLLIKSLPYRDRYGNKIDRIDNRGLSASELKELMETCYAFGIHVPKLKGVINIDEIKKTYTKNGVKQTRTYYKSTMEIDAEARLLIYYLDINTNQFVLYTTKYTTNPIILGSGSISESKEYNNKTYNDRKLFENCLEKFANALAANALYCSQREFLSCFSIEDVQGFTFFSKGMPNIRMDAPINVKKYIDADIVFSGWGKARHVSVNIDDETQKNNYQLIGGKVEEKDLGCVHPWTGVFSYGTIGKDDSGGSFSKLQIGSYLDLGYAANQKLLSEIWFDSALIYGFGEFGTDEVTLDLDATYYAVNFNVYKRLYLSPLSIYIAPGLGFEYRRTMISYYSEEYETNSMIAKAIVNAGYNISPDQELFISMAYNKLFNEDDLDDSGLVIQCGFAFHTPVIGGLWANIFGNH